MLDRTRGGELGRRMVVAVLAWPLLGLVILIAVIVAVTGGGVDSVRPFLGVAVAMLAIVALTALQKAHARVQVSPRIITVACFLVQHSPMLGQAASSHTVARLSSRISLRVL